MIIKIKNIAFIFAFLMLGISQESFEFNQSSVQAFYFIESSQIGGQDLDDDPDTDDCQDLNNDGQLTENAEICIGSYYWDGPYTTVPVMGNDGTRWTEGYIEEEEIPIFKIYDASENIIYPAVPSMAYPWTPDLNFYVISI